MSAARTWLWNHMLDAEFNCRYWRYMVDRHKARDQRAQILLAIAASGTVAGWTVWELYPTIWQVLSGAPALIVIALPIIKLSDRGGTAARFRQRLHGYLDA